MLFLIVLLIDIACGIFATKKNRSFWGYFILSLFFTPIVGFIFLLVLGNKSKDVEVNE